MAAILDEVMIKVLIANDWVAVTREMSVRYKRPARLGEKIILEGVIIAQKKKIVVTKGRAVNPDGEMLAEASGRYYIVEGEFKEKLLESLKR
jgi:acyl-coenzyme A thioesterase PaaI-like protein